jgi:hypothetical protein
MTQLQALKIKCAGIKFAAALVVVLAAGTFFYANQSTVASYAGSTTPMNALHRAPGVMGIDTAPALLW